MRLRVLSSLFCFGLLSFLVQANAQLGAPNHGLRNLPSGMSPDGGPSVIAGTCYGADGVPWAV